MKLSAVIFLTLALIPIPGFSQNYPGMSQIDMQKIQEMQTCMANVDQTQLQSIEQQQYKFDAEIKSLCGSGKRNEAQQQAMAYARKMMNNPAIKAMKKCGEIAKDMMSDMPFMDLEKDASGQHVCDSY